MVIDLCVRNDKCPWDPTITVHEIIFILSLCTQQFVVHCTVFYVCVSRHVDYSVASGQLSS